MTGYIPALLEDMDGTYGIAIVAPMTNPLFISTKGEPAGVLYVGSDGVLMGSRTEDHIFLCLGHEPQSTPLQALTIAAKEAVGA